jgi:aryl-alcohol dehydrogenase-like predicted oxidoreductase
LEKFMIRRRITKDRDVNAIGLGCMGMSAYYGAPMPEKEGVALLHAAIERGVDHFDTAEMYGFGANEQLLGAAFNDRREKVFIATKWGPTADPVTKLPVGVDGSEANMRRAVENSLRYLRTDHIDLYYLHRKDPKTPIEDSVSAMAKLVAEGKVRALGLSEVSAETLRNACKVHPIAAVQSEYSLFTRDYEADVIPACQELGVTFVAYSPLGRGMLTGAFGKDWKPSGPDFRTLMAPRFQGEALEANLALVAEVEALAAAKQVKAGQIALAWVLSRGDHIVTIPGTTKLANLESNLDAAQVSFSAGEAQRLDSLAARVQGLRYNERGMSAVNA